MTGTKPSLLQQLRSIKTRIGRSPISGVGVFAIQSIGQRVNPFPTRRMRLRKLPAKDLSKLPSPVRQLVHDYFAEDTSGYMIPDDFGAVVALESLVNHSDNPNLRYIRVRNIQNDEADFCGGGAYDRLPDVYDDLRTVEP